MRTAAMDLEYILNRREVYKKFEMNQKHGKECLFAQKWLSKAQESIQVRRFNKYQKLKDCPCSIFITSANNSTKN